MQRSYTRNHSPKGASGKIPKGQIRNATLPNRKGDNEQEVLEKLIKEKTQKVACQTLEHYKLNTPKETASRIIASVNR